MANKSIEDKYEKKTHHEHVLHYPDTYIGSVEKDIDTMWIYNDETDKIEKKEIEFVPGLYKIFDEILVNARDHTVRTKNCKTIKINIDKENGLITVYNDGDGIDIAIHKKEKVYIPELIFGHLLTSTNYDKKEEKIVGGKNGYGSKVCLKKGSKVIKFDGTLSKVEDIQIDDLLIGDDGKSRRVLDKVEGNEQLYKISQKKGEDYIVNGNHILCLCMPNHKSIFWDEEEQQWTISWLDQKEKKVKNKSIKKYENKDESVFDDSFGEMLIFSDTLPNDNTLDISVKDFIQLDYDTKFNLRGYIGDYTKWKMKTVDIDPYILGLYLGYSNGKNKDVEGYFKNIDKKILEKKFEKYDLVNKKYIPKNFLVNCRKTRLKILAGIIDNCGEITLSNVKINLNPDNKQLIEDIEFLSRSLGYITYKFNINSIKRIRTRRYKRQKTTSLQLILTGKNIKNIPTKFKRNIYNELNDTNNDTGTLFVEKVKEDKYIGLQVDGNNRFLLKDFTVTHNCNIFSEEFILETVDAKTKKKYKQRFTDNMYTIEKPKITNLTGKNIKPYTQISFRPDFKRFGLEKLTDDIISLMKKRVYDLSACTPADVKVYFNDKQIEFKSFEKYIDYFYPDNDNSDISESNNESEDNIETGFNLKKCKVYEQVNERWKVGVVFNPENGYEAISYVNGISTYKGGTHVEYIVNQVVKEINKMLQKKKKTIKLKPSQIKDNLTFYIDSVIVNPNFTSQLKEELTNKKDTFGSTCELSKKFYQKLGKTGIIQELIEFNELKQNSILKQNDGKKVNKISGIEKLEDAVKAGTKQSKKCRLILTEGDSAKALAMAGVSVIGRDYYGVFPLKGKLLNVRKAPPKQMLKNEEISNLKKILGLKHDMEYNDVSKLRYGSIVIFTDQDVDGSHIKGLIMNFIHYFWPSLAKINGFITCLTTPIVKVSKGKKKLEFYNLSEFEEWQEKIEKKGEKGWSNPKYYKGLGTSTASEAREYFRDFEDKLVRYYYTEDNKENKEEEISNKNNKCYDAITLAFAKKRENDKKLWLSKYSKEQFLENNQKEIPYHEFIHKELIHFSKYSNDRALPSFIDGFKTCQRKIYYVANMKNLHNQKKEIRVSQLAGAVSEKAHYHHGEASLCGAIVNMAQNYVGSNNINLLEPIGQFGTRLAGGKDSASVRYITTRFTSIANKIIREDDFPILERTFDDGEQVEPIWYAPIIPLLLVNGCEGVGTGFSTKIPCFNPLDIVKNIKRKMDGKEMKSLKPWYRNFKGHIIKNSSNKFEVRGEYKQISENVLEITELPIGTWTTPYKNFLESITIGTNNEKSKQKKEIIEEVLNYCSEVSIRFVIKFPEGKLYQYIEKGTLETKLKLVKTISTTNMHVHNENGLQIKKYKSPKDIISDFYDLRLELYKKRKEYLLAKHNIELQIISWKRKFIQFVIDGKIIVFKQKKENIYSKLEKLGFPKMDKNPLKQFEQINEQDEKETLDQEQLESDTIGNYDYLLNIKINKFTKEELQKLDNEYNDKNNIYEILKGKTTQDLWKEELDDFIEHYTIWDKEQTNIFEKNSKEVNEKVKGKGKGKGKNKSKIKIK